MTIREETEAIERQILSRYATLSENSLGRRVPLEPDPIRPCFQRDRDRILHCKAFRRLKQKTQVFLSPEGDHYRTRLTHTLEVSQIARTISRALRLNEDLTELSRSATIWPYAVRPRGGESAQPALPGRILPLPPEPARGGLLRARRPGP